MGKIIVGILILLFSIAGCSDMPYTGSMLSDHEVDRYLVSTDGSAVCFQDDLDSTCITLGPQTANGGAATDGPAVHIYPEQRVYLFYHEGNPILRAERGVDPTRTPQTTNPTGDPSPPNGGNPSTPNGGGNDNNNPGTNPTGNPPGGDPSTPNGGNNNNNNPGTNPTGNPPGGDPSTPNGGNNNNNNPGTNPSPPNGGDPSTPNGPDNNNNPGTNPTGNPPVGDPSVPPNGSDPSTPNGPDNNNDDSDDGHGWIIWIYYPEGTIFTDAPTLSGSGVTVTLNGKQLTDADITGFARFIGPNGEKGIQFFYATESAELLDLKVRMEGIVDDEDTVKFNINYLWNSP